MLQLSVYFIIIFDIIMKIKIYWKSEQKENPDFLEWVIFPSQTHSNNIIEIITWKENLKNCDWIFTSIKNNYKLAIRTADCTAITFYDEKNYWIIHAGWRWLTNWIIEKMLEKFDNPEIFVAPFLKKFEIQKDFCYDEIFENFWDKYFIEKEKKIIFNFEGALKSILLNKAIIDKRNTLEEKNFYSWRENKTLDRNYTIIENN